MSKCCKVPSSFMSASQARDMARDKSTIFGEISAIQQAILSATSLCTPTGGKFCTTVAGNTPMTFISHISEVEVTNGGSGYNPVPASVSFYHPDPLLDYTVADASASAVVANGAISSITITAGGSGYTPVIAQTTIQSTLGSGATLALDIVAGEILSATVIDAGNQYADGDVVVVSHPTGTGASLVVSQTGSPTGTVVTVTVINGGIGYQPIQPRVEINHPYGVNFNGIPQVNGLGEIIGVTITNAGIGYQTLLPILTVDDVYGHSAEFLVNVTAGAVTSVDVLDGGVGYTNAAVGIINPIIPFAGTGAKMYINAIAGEIVSVILTESGLLYRSGLYVLEAPTGGVSAHLYLTVDSYDGKITDVSVLAGGAGYVTSVIDVSPHFEGVGATVDLTVVDNPYGTNPHLYYAAFVDSIDDAQKIDQINQVVAYFRGLGYAITPSVNPDTNSTIQWKICW